MKITNDDIKARPILFNTPMIQALLDGRKTQTRRVIKDTFNGKQIVHARDCNSKKVAPIAAETMAEQVSVAEAFCPFGAVGDLLYVRESLGLRIVVNHRTNKMEVWANYKASNPNECFKWNGRNDVETIPSIHMPRWASRLTLEITDVRVERLKDITEQDAIKEGVESGQGWEEPPGYGFLDYSVKDDESFSFTNPKESFRTLWQSTGGDWGSNPWVWVIEFKTHKCDVDEYLKNL